MNTKTYVIMGALAATALMVGGFVLPATVPVAYADNNSINVKTNTHTNQHNNCHTKDSVIVSDGFYTQCENTIFN